MKFNKTEIEKLPYPVSGQKLYWDDAFKGFGIRVTTSAKTYIVESRVNGKTTRVKIGRHGVYTVETARNQALALLKQMSDGVSPNNLRKEQAVKSVTLRVAFDDFKESRRGKLRPKTVAVYDSVMRRCFPDWQDLALLSITKDMVEKRHLEISTANGPRGTGRAQAHQAMRTLRAIYNYALVKYEDNNGNPVLTTNPVKRLNDLKLWHKVPRRKSVIRPEQLKAWAKAVYSLDNIIVRDFLLLLLFTGLRRTEASSLEWSDIDFQAKTLKIPAERTKNGHEHQLPLSDFLIQLLSNRVRRIDSPFVFPGNGKTGYVQEPKRQKEQVIKASGVQFICHDLRRTFISAAESLDISHYALKRLVNHRDSSDVTEGYIVNDVERLREPMQRITSYIFEKAGLEELTCSATDKVECLAVK